MAGSTAWPRVMRSREDEMPDSIPFDELLRRLHDREDAAAWAQFYNAYLPRLLALARKRLGPFSRYTSPETVVLSAFKSFYTRHRADAFSFCAAADLWRLLAEIVVRKCLNHIRKWTRECRDVRLQEPVDGKADEVERDRRRGLPAEPRPEVEAEFNELLELVIGSFPGKQQHLVKLLLKNYNDREIAEGTLVNGTPLPPEDQLVPDERISEATVRRIRKKLEKNLQDLLTSLGD
jgi:DNA-directed RNA polymerase specialized sigma24 family protein